MILLSQAMDASNVYKHIASCAEVCERLTASRHTPRPFGMSSKLVNGWGGGVIPAASCAITARFGSPVLKLH